MIRCKTRMILAFDLPCSILDHVCGAISGCSPMRKIWPSIESLPQDQGDPPWCRDDPMSD